MKTLLILLFVLMASNVQAALPICSTQSEVHCADIQKSCTWKGATFDSMININAYINTNHIAHWKVVKTYTVTENGKVSTYIDVSYEDPATCTSIQSCMDFVNGACSR